jgi:hypothetical protein
LRRRRKTGADLNVFGGLMSPFPLLFSQHFLYSSKTRLTVLQRILVLNRLAKRRATSLMRLLPSAPPLKKDAGAKDLIKSR